MLSIYLSLLETDEERNQFSKIYEEYLDWMLKIAYHYLKNEDDAKDAVHEIFFDIAKNGHLPPITSVDETKAYLFICVRNRASRIVRKRNKRKMVNLGECYNISSNYNLQNEFVKEYDKERLLLYINSLNQIYKDVLVLYFANGNTIKEISSILGIPSKTAETRLRRGKELVKEEFGDLDI